MRLKGPDQRRAGLLWTGPSGGVKIAVLISCLALAGCASFPEVARFSGDDGTVPHLLPLDTLLAQQGSPVSDPGPALAGRAAQLKARTVTADPH